MPVAFCKEAFTEQLVALAEVSGPQNAGESCPRYQENRLIAGLDDSKKLLQSRITDIEVGLEMLCRR